MKVDKSFYVLIGYVLIGIAVCFLIAGGLYGCPKYKVYKKELDGKARLKEAEWDKQIEIEVAKAKEESADKLGKAIIIEAEYRAKADSIRATGIAKANIIIDSSITDKYIRWLFVDQLDQTNNQIIYIPTEAGIPIMESTRNKTSK